MKNLLLIGFILLFTISCRKDKQAEKIYLDHIMAGESSGVGLKHSGILNDTLFFEYPNSNERLFVDMNDDGVDDFELWFFGSQSQGHKNTNYLIVPIGDNYLSTTELENDFIDTLSKDDVIDDQLNWVSDTCVLYRNYWDYQGNTSNAGLWNYTKNKYVGTKIIVDGHALYGWIKLEVTGSSKLTLFEHACTFGFENI